MAAAATTTMTRTVVLDVSDKIKEARILTLHCKYLLELALLIGVDVRMSNVRKSTLPPILAVHR